MSNYAVKDKQILHAMGMVLDEDTHYVVRSLKVPLYSVFYYKGAFYEFAFVSGRFHPCVIKLTPKGQEMWVNRYMCYQLFSAGFPFNPSNSAKAANENLTAGQQQLIGFRYHPKDLFYFGPSGS